MISSLYTKSFKFFWSFGSITNHVILEGTIAVHYTYLLIAMIRCIIPSSLEFSFKMIWHVLIPTLKSTTWIEIWNLLIKVVLELLWTHTWLPTRRETLIIYVMTYSTIKIIKAKAKRISACSILGLNIF